LNEHQVEMNIIEVCPWLISSEETDGAGQGSLNEHLVGPNGAEMLCRRRVATTFVAMRGGLRQLSGTKVPFCLFLIKWI
jgi:hypothetical protein